MIFTYEARQYAEAYLKQKFPNLLNKTAIFNGFTKLATPAASGVDLIPKVADVFYFCMATTNDNSGFRFHLDTENTNLEEQTSTPIIFDRCFVFNNGKNIVLTGYKIKFE